MDFGPLSQLETFALPGYLSAGETWPVTVYKTLGSIPSNSYYIDAEVNNPQFYGKGLLYCPGSPFTMHTYNYSTSYTYSLDTLGGFDIGVPKVHRITQPSRRPTIGDARDPSSFNTSQYSGWQDVDTNSEWCRLAGVHGGDNLHGTLCVGTVDGGARSLIFSGQLGTADDDGILLRD